MAVKPPIYYEIEWRHLCFVIKKENTFIFLIIIYLSVLGKEFLCLCATLKIQS